MGEVRTVRTYCDWFFNWPGDKDEDYNAMFALSVDSCGFILAAPFLGEVMGYPHRIRWRALLLLDWKWTWTTWAEIKAMDARSREEAKQVKELKERLYLEHLVQKLRQRQAK